MSTDVLAPAAGESVTEVEISKWMVKDGDTVNKDQVIAEVETEKASLEVRSPVSGKISITVIVGTVVKPGTKVAVVSESAAEKLGNIPATPAPDAKDSKNPVGTPAQMSIPTTTLNANLDSEVNISVPNFGESVKEGEITTWKVKDGDMVNKDQLLLQIESDKATLDVVASAAGKLKIVVPSGKVNVGQKIGNISVSEADISVTSERDTISLPSTKSATVFNGPEGDLNIYASPSVRKMLLENNVDIKDFLSKSGVDNKSITADEVKKYLTQRSGASSNSSSSTSMNSGNAAVTTGVSSTTTTQGATGRESVSKKMTRLRQIIAKRLVNAQQTSALLTTFNEIDMGEVIAIRSQYKELFKKKHEVGLGFMSFFVKAVCHALLEFPVINSMIDNDNIVENHFVDMGIAVATPKGLVVPVIRNAESLSFKQIEGAILEFGKKGKEGTIGMDDLVGGTFTITNGGTFGSMLSTPIINFPQSAILGMHNIVERPVVKNGEIVIRPVMYVALTYDHRIIDGADSVRFLYRVKEFIEDPNRLLVGV